MASSPSTGESPRPWWDIAGCSRFLQIFRLAASPPKILLVLVALAFSLSLGTVLDSIWVRAGGGVESAAAADTRSGVFETWWIMQRGALLEGVSAVCRVDLLSDARSGQPGLLASIGAAVGSLIWVFKQHPLYSIIFFGLSLLVWGLVCGAICRMNALEHGRGQLAAAPDALAYARQHWLGGFVAAPLMPILFLLVLAATLAMGGLLMSIPWLGDIVGGLFFILGIMVGLLFAYAVVISMLGGMLFWPAIAVDGHDATECVTHCVGYVQSRLFRVLWYLLVTIVLIAVTLAVIWWLVGWGLQLTQQYAGWGADLVTDRKPVSSLDTETGGKLDAVWSIHPGDWFGPAQYELRTHDKVSRALVGFWVYVVHGAVWALAINLWLAAGVVAYFLLRREIDNIDDRDVYGGGPESDIVPQGLASESIAAGQDAVPPGPPPGDSVAP